MTELEACGSQWRTEKQQAMDPNTSPEVLGQLATHHDWHILSWVACNPNTPAAVADKLNKSIDVDLEKGNDFIQGWMAGQLSTTPERLARLAEVGSEEVLLRVSRNPNTPPLIKMWAQSGRYGGVPLKEFLESSSPTT